MDAEVRRDERKVVFYQAQKQEFSFEQSKIFREWKEVEWKLVDFLTKHPFFSLLPPRFFWKDARSFVHHVAHWFPHPHIRTREQTRSCASRTQRVSNSRLHPSPSPAIRWHIVFCAWRNAILLPSPVKEIRVKPSPANHCFIASYSRIVKRWRQKTKNSGRARYACALGDEVGCRCTLEKGLLVVARALQVSDEPQYNPSVVLELNWIILFVCLFRTSRRK